jgi:hypothetical protein
MSRKIDFILNKDHVGGGFEWKVKPICSCGRLIEAVDKDKFVFVSNFVDGDGEEETNLFYMMPLDANGSLARSKGVQISHCPWCGDKIVGRKNKAASV